MDILQNTWIFLSSSSPSSSCWFIHPQLTTKLLLVLNLIGTNVLKNTRNFSLFPSPIKLIISWLNGISFVHVKSQENFNLSWIFVILEENWIIFSCQGCSQSPEMIQELNITKMALMKNDIPLRRQSFYLS